MSTYLGFIAMFALTIGLQQARAVTGGQSTRGSEFQNVVRIKTSTPAGIRTCTGTLVEQDVVFTAAHCFVEGRGQIFGKPAQESIVEQFIGGELYKAKVKRVYLNFDARYFNTDFAVVYLSNPLQLSQHLLFLPAHDWDEQALLKIMIRPKKTYSAVQGIAVGYGSTVECENDRSQCQLPEQAVFTDILVGSASTCVQNYIGSDRLIERMFCGLTPGKVDPVQGGDSGGPLFIPLKDNQLLFAGVLRGSSGSLRQLRPNTSIYVAVHSALETLEPKLPRRLNLDRLSCGISYGCKAQSSVTEQDGETEHLAKRAAKLCTEFIQAGHGTFLMMDYLITNEDIKKSKPVRRDGELTISNVCEVAESFGFNVKKAMKD